MNYQIFGVSFKRKKDLLFSLGYKSYISEWQIEKQYNGIENLIKYKLGLQDETEIKKKLQELRDLYYKNQELNINESVLLVLRSAYRVLTNSQKLVLLTSVSTLTNQDAEELRKEVDAFIND